MQVTQKNEKEVPVLLNKTILVSACLLGLGTDYKGSTDNRCQELLGLASRFVLVPVCPEQLGGLPTPRPPCEVEKGDSGGVWNGTRRVLRHNEEDSVSQREDNTIASQREDNTTARFINGARETLAVAQLVRPAVVVLKSRSPSCGVHRIHDGSFSHRLVDGPGVTADLLQREGYLVVDEHEALEYLDKLQEGGSHE